MPLRAMACTRSSRGTSSGTMALQAGAVSAEPMPMAKVRDQQDAGGHGVAQRQRRPVGGGEDGPDLGTDQEHPAIDDVGQGASGQGEQETGMMVAACTMATIRGRGASVVISQPAPVFCSQVPSQATTLASQRRRNVLLRSGTRAGGRRIMRRGRAVGVAGHDTTSRHFHGRIAR